MNKVQGIEIGWNQKLYNIVEEFLFDNRDNSVNLEVRRKINNAFNNYPCTISNK